MLIASPQHAAWPTPKALQSAPLPQLSTPQGPIRPGNGIPRSRSPAASNCLDSSSCGFIKHLSFPHRPVHRRAAPVTALFELGFGINQQVHPHAYRLQGLTQAQIFARGVGNFLFHHQEVEIRILARITAGIKTELSASKGGFITTTSKTTPVRSIRRRPCKAFCANRRPWQVDFAASAKSVNALRKRASAMRSAAKRLSTVKACSRTMRSSSCFASISTLAHAHRQRNAGDDCGWSDRRTWDLKEFQSQPKSLGINGLVVIQGGETLNTQLLGDGNVQGIGTAQTLLIIVCQGRRRAVSGP